MINQFGNALTVHGSVLGLIAALAALAYMLYLLFRPYREAVKLSRI